MKRSRFDSMRTWVFCRLTQLRHNLDPSQPSPDFTRNQPPWPEEETGLLQVWTNTEFPKVLQAGRWKDKSCFKGQHWLQKVGIFHIHWTCDWPKCLEHDFLLLWNWLTRPKEQGSHSWNCRPQCCETCGGKRCAATQSREQWGSCARFVFDYISQFHPYIAWNLNDQA